MTYRQKITDQLEQGAPWLKFEDNLEYRFLADFNQRLAKPRALVLMMALLFVSAAPVYEAYVFPTPEQYLKWALPVQVFVQIPVMVFCIFICWSKRWRSWSSGAMITASLAMTGGMLIERYVGATSGYDVPYSFVPTVIAATFFLGRPRFRGYIGPAILAAAVLFYVETLLSSSAYEAFYKNIAIGILLIVGAVGGYVSEHTWRIAWLNQQLLEESSASDYLTNIYNRRGAEKALNEMLQAASADKVPVGLMLLDIDYFKNYNDTYGHSAGDECLQMVAKELAAAARRPLDVVARMGGEEFLIAWYDVDPNIIESIADTIRADVQAKKLEHKASNVSPYVTVSGGLVCVVPQAQEDLHYLLARADKNLYKAKDRGRNGVIYTPDLL